MNSSSEIASVPNYLPLAYPELNDLLEQERAAESAEDAISAGSAEGAPAESSIAAETPSEEAPAPSPDPAELLAAHLAEETARIRAELQKEMEQQVQAARHSIARSVDAFAKERAEYFRQVESEVVGLALAVVKKILHREIQMDRRLLAGLVAHELRQVEDATEIRLIVAKEERATWDEIATTLPRAVTVMAEAAANVGEVRIETGVASTLISVDQELKEVERGFFDLLAHRPVIFKSDTASVQ